MTRALAAVATWSFLLTPAHAAGPAPVAPGHEAEGESPHEDAHAPHAHHLAVFGGATLHGEYAAPSVGLDYAYFLPVLDRRIGVGPFFDATFPAVGAEMVLGLALAMKGPIGVQLALAPIVELARTEEGDSPVEQKWEHEWGGRLNLSYGFHLQERFSLGPSVSADFFPHHVAYVLGLNAGLGF